MTLKEFCSVWDFQYPYGVARIEDYDGMESIHTPEDNDWIIIETKELPAPESNKGI